MTARIAAVLIGRNEGTRLVAALASLPADVTPVVYVDSGSSDGSVAVARAAGARVVELDAARPFTAARARNAGLAALGAARPDYVQLMDGDCTLQPGWIATAAAFLDAHPTVAVACGRRRERFPDATIYNRQCDREWDTPPGPARSCGGDALVRRVALEQVAGFDPRLIAGEEPDLCLRLRAAGWQVWRLPAEMTIHDADIRHLGQWWRRQRRAGHAFAEGAARHGSGPERHFRRETWRAVLWGAVLPLVAFAGMAVTPATLLLLLLWPLQAMRLSRRMGGSAALLTVAGKLPEAAGVAEYWLRRRFWRPRGLIEYK